MTRQPEKHFLIILHRRHKSTKAQPKTLRPYHSLRIHSALPILISNDVGRIKSNSIIGTWSHPERAVEEANLWQSKTASIINLKSPTRYRRKFSTETQNCFANKRRRRVGIAEHRVKCVKVLTLLRVELWSHENRV